MDILIICIWLCIKSITIVILSLIMQINSLFKIGATLVVIAMILCIYISLLEINRKQTNNLYEYIEEE